MRLWTYRKRIKTNYETQFSIILKLKDEIEKQINKIKKTHTNNPELQPESWDQNNQIESKFKFIMKLNFQSAQCWKMQLKKIHKKNSS
jgi:hypothetical protein